MIKAGSGGDNNCAFEKGIGTPQRIPYQLLVAPGARRSRRFSVATQRGSGEL
jgi:hypothetical protein